MDIDVKAINDDIITQYEKDSKKTIRRMTKNGFVSIDGVIKQYNPHNNRFIEIGAGYYNAVYNDLLKSLGNYWGILSPMNAENLLKKELPNITEKDANDFAKYQEQSQVVINEELIQDLLKEAINENKELQRLNADFKGKKDLVSQITVLRNNDIFTDNKKRLFKLKDGEFLRYASNDIRGVLNNSIAADDISFNIHEVKNNFHIYNDNLTDITKVHKLLKIKQHKIDVMTECKPGFEKVLKIIAKYGGKK